MKKLKINKIALSAATAFLMLTSIVSTVASASGGNEIKLTSDKTFAQAGDSINITASLEPDKTGVAGFTIDLHYDPSKVTVYVPTEAESEGAYNVGSKFSVITNYVASSGTVKIVGANLTGSNIKDTTDLALATFKVKDGVSGDINYWIDVQTIVAEADGGYKTVSYSAPTEGSPLAVSAGEEVTTPATTTTSAKSETTTTTSKAATTTTKKTETKSETTTTTSSQAVTTTTAKPAEEVTTTTAKSEKQTSAVTTTTTASSTAQPDEKPFFTHKQGDADFNSETSLQYGFKLSDYITDYSKHYNIKVGVKSTGNASGAVGALVDGNWSAQSAKLSGVETAQWIYSDLDPARTSDEVFLQLYYLKANADFEITSIEVTPVSETVDTTAVTKATAAETQPAETTTTSTKPKADNGSETAATTTTAEQPANDGAAVTTTVSESDSTEVTTSAQATEKIQQIVDEASSQADSSKVNPSTGVEVTKNILTVIAAGYVIFAIFAVIFNRFAAKDEE
ncbi:cohesin domain-containing protein [uncultured Ruminococcus sp.]|uniref:cohesin domain-containing protein n=1 Tax=uncultured Ruminococcus sp. TaxID=165186 RepID=UPI00260A61FA|nr:cohesin domain-containing protein [uncultured Ruminococcus sp.]